MQTAAVGLSEEHKQTLKRFGEEYKIWINSDDGLRQIREHREHQAIFREKLSSKNIDSLTENEFKEVCKNLWAIRGWTDKEWRIENLILTPNGFDKIKSELKKLLYGTEEFVNRYDTFRRNIKGLGMASLSEILNMIFPDRYCIWNDTLREVVPFLKLDTLLPPKFLKSGISSGKEYNQCLQLLTGVKNELEEFGIHDFLELDFFLWHIRDSIIPSLEKKQLKIKDKETPEKEDQIALWVVRAGKKGGQEKAALQNNIVVIGWNELDDLSSIHDYDHLRQYYSQINSKENIHQIGAGSSQVWSFLKKIKKGDIVAIPLKSQNAVAIGKVVGDYEYKKEYGDNVRHTRSVEWLKNIPRSEFDNNSMKAFDRPPTVYKIEGVGKDHIKTVLLKYGITELGTDNKEDMLQPIAEEQQKIEPVQTLDELSKQTYFSVNTITEIYELLNEKKQIIFYGPPGTSKTYFAKHFALYFTQNKDNIEIIQFHPSYSYEDFVEGIRPILSENRNAAGFSLQKGILRRIVDRCLEIPNQKFVLIIDEINRGNIAKIFGELIYLLDYRNESISLTYSSGEKRFQIPSNLYIIGTMNSADRSIAFVDYALRRRFYFIDFYPDLQILRAWLNEYPVTDIDYENIINMLIDINKIIEEKIGKEYQIGQSYLMKKVLDVKSLRKIINYAIMPLIEVYFFGKREQINALKDICNRVLSSAPSDQNLPS